jgi:predicted ribosomally synthesized peptide with SipW-like signal peptide
MKRNILVSLMIIGAVAALVSGATFATFTDSATVTDTITTGTVNISLDAESDSDTGTFSWDPCTQSPLNVGSLEPCESTVEIFYNGTLNAELTFAIVPTGATGCFGISMGWDGATPVEGLSLGPVPADSASLVVSVMVTDDGEACQGVDLGLELTVTATEVLPS